MLPFRWGRITQSFNRTLNAGIVEVLHASIHKPTMRWKRRRCARRGHYRIAKSKGLKSPVHLIGPVDLLCHDAGGATVAVEIKRRGEIDGVEQLARYVEFLERDPRLRPVRGIFAAQLIKPQAKVLAAERGIDCVELDYDELRGVESNALKLF